MPRQAYYTGAQQSGTSFFASFGYTQAFLFYVSIPPSVTRDVVRINADTMVGKPGHFYES